SLVREKATHGGAAVPHAEIDALQLRVECAVVQTCQGQLRGFHFLERPVTEIGGAGDHFHPSAPSRMPASRGESKGTRRVVCHLSSPRVLCVGGTPAGLMRERLTSRENADLRSPLARYERPSTRSPPARPHSRLSWMSPAGYAAARRSVALHRLLGSAD